MKEKIKSVGVKLGIFLLILAFLIGIAIVFFPHYIMYFKVKIKYPSIDEIITYYPYNGDTLTDNYTEVKKSGLKIKIPNEHLNPNYMDGYSICRSDTITVMVIEVENDFITYEQDDYNKFEKEQYQHFFNTLGEKIPESTYEQIVFIRKNITSDVCLKLRGTDLKVFEEFAQAKQQATSMETVYYYGTDKFNAIFCELKGKKKYTCNFFIDDKSNQKHYIVFFSSNDKKLINQIINSVEIN